MWLMLRPDQLAAEDGEVGFLHPSGGGGGAATHSPDAALGVEDAAADGGGATRLSFIPVTDVRTADTDACGWLAEVCGCGGKEGAREHVMVRYEFSSLPPGVQTVKAELARGRRAPQLEAGFKPELKYSATTDELTPAKGKGGGDVPKAETFYDPTQVPGPDGNAVDIDHEMSRLALNQQAFQASTVALNKRLSMIRLAIMEGRG